MASSTRRELSQENSSDVNSEHNSSADEDSQLRLRLKKKLQRNRTSFSNDQIDSLEKGTVIIIDSSDESEKGDDLDTLFEPDICIIVEPDVTIELNSKIDEDTFIIGEPNKSTDPNTSVAKKTSMSNDPITSNQLDISIEEVSYVIIDSDTSIDLNATIDLDSDASTSMDPDRVNHPETSNDQVASNKREKEEAIENHLKFLTSSLSWVDEDDLADIKALINKGYDFDNDPSSDLCMSLVPKLNTVWPRRTLRVETLSPTYTCKD